MKNFLIPRSLVPQGVSLPEATEETAPRRLTTLLDDRTVVAANLPRNGGLDTRTNIPSHMPLDVLASRTVVPRDMPQTPFDAAMLRPGYDQVTPMDHRVSIPAAMPVVRLQTRAPVSSYSLPDVIEPNMINTGEVNLSVEAIEEPSKDWDWWARVGSAGLHLLLILFLIFQARIFPYRAPSQDDIDRARQQLNFIYMPSDVRGEPRAPSPTPLTSRNLRVNPGELRKLLPEMQPSPTPRAPSSPVVRETPPPEAPPELPPAPRQQNDNTTDFLRGNAAPAQQAAPQQRVQQAPPQASASAPPPNSSLILPRFGSPGHNLDQSASQALQGSGGGGTTETFSAPVPRRGLQGGGGGFGGGGGGGGAQGSGSLQMLTPTEGVDFSGYLQRVLASVKRNWYSIMPESVYLGEKGLVVIQFKIMKNGAVIDPDPSLIDTSGKEPLDRAATASIRASSPFEPLPPAFSGPYIELRFFFYYNLRPPNY